MSTIVTDNGFKAATAPVRYLRPGEVPANDCKGFAVDLDVGDDLGGLRDRLHCIYLIRIDFPSFADGRGFTLARQIRRLGYTGHLRAAGQVIADQYAMARRSGFDDVEISDDQARRQPMDQWAFRANWRDFDYQSRLRG